jgi:uncharacterized membrane protein
MIRLIFFLALLALPATAMAQAFPGLYSVVGVASDDTLNIRSGPGASHGIVGELAHDAVNVEVVAKADGANWGLVNTGERSGWVSLSFLQDQGGDWNARRTSISSCFGTEPFWDVTGFNGILELRNLGEPLFSAPADQLVSARAIGRLAASAAGPNGFVGVAIRAERCNDGMSDRNYGLSATVISRLDGQGTAMWTGCCSLQP